MIQLMYENARECWKEFNK